MADRAHRVGQVIGDYHLIRWLGGGGFGEVYLGEHTRTQSQVAVKVLQTRLTGTNELKEFLNEARTFRLRHPHIIQLIDFGVTHDDVPYLVMEYATHGTLRDIHPKKTQVPFSTILSYVTPLASALQYAHDQQLIHRDVKPENMLLNADGQVQLSDFGIAAVAHSSRSLNTQEGISGTLPNMAPEQIHGKPRPASDQYALGIVVYEWFTGNCPFKGTAVEVAMQHSITPPPPLREQVPTIPVEVEQVVLTALNKDPKARFATIHDFAIALQQTSGKMATVSQVTYPSEVPSSLAATIPAKTMTILHPGKGEKPVERKQIASHTSASLPFTSTKPAVTDTLTANRLCTLVLGIVFAIIGIIGFFTPLENATGVEAIFGIFDTDTVQNIVNLLIGITAIACLARAHLFNRAFGIFVTLLGILGLIPSLYFPQGAYGTDLGLFLGLTHLSTSDHSLHLVLGIAALICSFFSRRSA